MLLPSTLPYTKSDSPLNDEPTFTTNSGAEVPNDTIVKPITISDTPNPLAKAEPPSTKNLHL